MFFLNYYVFEKKQYNFIKSFTFVQTTDMPAKNKTRLAVFASGSGSNAENLVRYFHGHPFIEIALVVTNRADAFVLKRAERFNLPAVVISPSEWQQEESIKTLFLKKKIDGIVLAGYLLLIPEFFIRMYPEKIINIHPALLPEFGGKGMYGMHVHRAVINSGARKSGITIHIVDEAYDRGEIIFQQSLDVKQAETPESLAKRVQKLEHQHYPVVVEKYFAP